MTKVVLLRPSLVFICESSKNFNFFNLKEEISIFAPRSKATFRNGTKGVSLLGYPIFYPYRGMEGIFPGGVQKCFPRESGTKIIFPRRSRQVFQRDHAS